MQKINKEIHILRISTRIMPDYGGPAKNAYNISFHSANQLFHFYNIAPVPPFQKTYTKKTKVNPNFTIYYLPFHSPDLNNRNFIRDLAFLFNFFVFSLFKAIKLHREHRIDIIHTHSPFITNFTALAMKKIFRIPYIYTLHGLDFSFKIQYYIDLNLGAKQANKISTISSKIVRFLKTNSIFKNKEIHETYNAIECKPLLIEKKETKLLRKLALLNEYDILNYGNKPKVILYVGYMTLEQKVNGMIDFVKAFDSFLKLYNRNEQNQFILIIIGHGKYRFLLEKEIEKVEIKKNIILLGNQDQNTVDNFFSIADLSILTSYIEGFPNVILESFNNAVPIIATKVGDVPKIVKKGTGFLVKPGDIDKMKEILLLYFSDKDLQEKMKKKAYSKIKTTFNWKNLSYEYRNLYLSLIIESRKKNQ